MTVRCSSRYRRGSIAALRRRLATTGVLLVVAAIAFGTGDVAALESDEANPLAPLDTSSPRATYVSFTEQVQLVEELYLEYQRNRTASSQRAFSEAVTDVGRLFDLSDVATANREEVAVAAFARLADILNRIPEPDLDEFPDADDVEAAQTGTGAPFVQTDESVATGGSLTPNVESSTRPAVGIDRYVIPETEITIIRLPAGSRAGDYVFSAGTLTGLKGWRETVDRLPVRNDVVVSDWVSEISNATGHLIPQWLLDAVPEPLDRQVFGTPLWKVMADAITMAVAVAATWAWRRLVVSKRATPSVAGFAWRMTTPVFLLVAIVLARRFMNEQINHSGEVATFVNLVVTIMEWFAVAWIFWLGSSMVTLGLVESPRFGNKDQTHLTRVLGKVVSVVGVLVIGWVGLDQIGVSSVGLGVGAGVIALAVSLAATGTLENLIGGITLYADKPFGVGEKITVGEDFGTVEEIGPRSTSLRKPDDKMVILPNSEISRLKITNSSSRRHMEFRHVIGVRYETSADQLRAIVRRIDRRLREHPSVLDLADYPRVLVVNFGESSIDIEVRAKVDTDEVYEFQLIQQDLLLRVLDEVESAGSGFAFPSTTTYIAQDEGLAGAAVAEEAETLAD